MNDDDDDGK